MGRVISRTLGAVLSLAVVGAAGWGLSRPYAYEVFGRWVDGPICMCIFTPFDDTTGWRRLDAGRFWLRAPQETSVQRGIGDRGTFVDRRFTLVYAFTDQPFDPGFPAAGKDYAEERVSIDGRDGIFRRAEFPARAEPYFLSLYVPHLVPTGSGGWYGLEIHGWFATYERRQLAQKILGTVDFTPLLVTISEPQRPEAGTPVFEIDHAPTETRE